MPCGPPAEPSLDEEQRAQLEAGVAHFNRGAYFECHDALEELWRGLRGPGRDFFQGLIQIAVAFYHLDGSNAAGAESMLTRAAARLAGYPPDYLGFDLALWRNELEARRAALREGDRARAAARPPSWHVRASDVPRRP